MQPVHLRMTLSPPPPQIRHVRNHHSLAFQPPFANTDIYKCSFFPQTITGWNSLTDTLLSAAEGAEDSVAQFTSLVRFKDKLLSSQALVNDCHLNVSPVTILILLVNGSGTCEQDLQLTSATPRVNGTIAHDNAFMHVIL